MKTLTIDVTGLPGDILEEHKHSIIAAVEDQVEYLIDNVVNPDNDEEIDYSQYVSWDVQDG